MLPALDVSLVAAKRLTAALREPVAPRDGGREPCSGHIAILVYPRGREESGHRVILAPLDICNDDTKKQDARLVSDSHARACEDVKELLGSSWQRTRVHSARNAQDLVPRSARSLVASAIWRVFEQPDERAVRSQVDNVLEGLRPRFPAAADLLAYAEPTSSRTSASRDRSRVRSTNPLERVDRSQTRWWHSDRCTGLRCWLLC